MGFPNVIIQSFACYVNTKVTEKIHKKFANVLTEYRFHYIISKLENVLINELEIQYKQQTLLGEKLHLTFDGRECTMENDNGDINVIIKVVTGI